MQKKISELKREVKVLQVSKPKPEIDEKSIERAKEQGFRQAGVEYEQKNPHGETEYQYTCMNNGERCTTVLLRKYQLEKIIKETSGVDPI